MSIIDYKELLAVLIAIGGTFIGFAVAMWRAVRESTGTMSDTAAKTSQMVGRVEGSVEVIKGEIKGVATTTMAMQSACRQRFISLEKRQDFQEQRLEASEGRLTVVEECVVDTKKRVHKLESYKTGKGDRKCQDTQ